MKRFTISILILTVLTAAGIAVWLTLDRRAKAEKLEAEILKGLTAEELKLVLKSEAAADRPAIETLRDDPEKRRAFLKGLRETLALAAQARREGFTEDENFRLNLAYKKKILLADLYLMKLSAGRERLYVVPPEEIEAVRQNPADVAAFERDMRALREIRIADERAKGRDGQLPQLLGESLEKARGKWARTKILAERAQADREFINQPAIPLRFRILEAGILAADYLRANYREHLRASAAEIAEFIRKHPEYDVRKKQTRAADVLKKARAGEDFAKLAEEYSEDRASKTRGGLYEDISTNVVWPEVEAAALKLKPGEISPHLVESTLGWHIVKLERKNEPKKPDKSDLKFTVRHIVLQKKFEEPGERLPGIPPPFLSAAEIAKAAIERDKRERFVRAALEKNPVSLPADFPVELPEIKEIGRETPESGAKTEKN